MPVKAATVMHAVFIVGFLFSLNLDIPTVQSLGLRIQMSRFGVNTENQEIIKNPEDSGLIVQMLDKCWSGRGVIYSRFCGRCGDGR